MEINDHSQYDTENPSIPLEVSMKKELESHISPTSHECCIYRVSERLRLSNERVYTPQVVSIGPLHHGNESLKPMEIHKKKYLQSFLKRTNIGLEHYISIIRENEDRLRSSYSEPIPFSSDELVRMILIDSAFVAEILLMNWFNDRGHGLFNKPWVLQDLIPDFWMLENQIPFFVLEDLLSTVRGGENGLESLSINEICYKLYKVLLDFDRDWDSLKYIGPSKVLHFVDFIRKFCVPMNDDKGSKYTGGKLETLSIPSVSDLVNSGVKIKASKSSTCLCEIRFSEGVLEIPKMGLTFVSELATRNVLAFEQRHFENEALVNDYVVVINRLVSAPSDVEFLVKQGIVENKLGDRAEVLRFTRKLADGVIVKTNDFCFADVCNELNRYSKTPWNVWKESLKKKYFNSPWAVVSVLAAILLIVLTIVQAVCSVISVTYKVPHF